MSETNDLTTGDPSGSFEKARACSRFLEKQSLGVPEYLNAQVMSLVEGRKPSDLTADLRIKLKTELRKALGLDPLPERTPLNPAITGRLEREGYDVEKLVFEPTPRFYASAYLYLPHEGSVPFPAVVSPVGHWKHKKLQPVVQARCIGLALLGFAVLCIDMPGFYGPNPDERNFPGNHCDWRLHMASFPPIAAMVWDVVRAIDYLLTRSEVDGSRIGVTGESGGGMTTMYAAVVDDRISCYVPVCYAVSYQDNYDNGCYCNHVPGVMRIGDRSDVMALATPKPVLLIGAEDDPEFPKEGTLRAHAKLRAFYEALGKAPDCQVFVAPGGHDYSRDARERMYGFFLRYLRKEGSGEPVREPRELPPRDGEPPKNVEDPDTPNSFCFVSGKAPADARSLLDLAAEKGRALANRVPLQGNLREQLRKRLLEVFPPPPRVPLEPEVLVESRENEEVFSGSFVSEPGLRIPFHLSLPAGSALPVCLIFSENGLLDPDAKPVAQRKKYAELRVGGRGLGAASGLDIRVATYIGRPPVVMWAWDVVRAVELLQHFERLDTTHIEAWGFGPAGGQVAYIAALYEPRITRAYGVNTIRSYLDLFEQNCVSEYACPARILEVADLPSIRKAVNAD